MKAEELAKRLEDNNWTPGQPVSNDLNRWGEERRQAAALLRQQAAEIERLREVALDVTASLTAAVSLLERGGKKAAPSDTMFIVMLADYNASISRARSAMEASDG